MREGAVVDYKRMWAISHSRTAFFGNFAQRRRMGILSGFRVRAMNSNQPA
jgi:hypothetical protein